MIHYKSEEEIEIIKQGSNILSKTLGVLSEKLKPGITLLALDKLANEYICDNGAKPSFKGYSGYKYNICTSINDQVVHGLPSKYELKETDICSIDCGVFFKGYHSDSAYTYPMPNVGEEVIRFLSVTKKSLYLGIDEIKEGIRTGDIGYTIQKYVEKHHYSVIRDLVGHGIGKELHESPEFPNFGKPGKGMQLKNGIVFALEPMTALGNYNLYYDSDGWTVKTIDGSLSAHFEHTIALINGKAEVLTTFDYIDEEFTSF